jgi:putative transferase (TIGR04331 family)
MIVELIFDLLEKTEEEISKKQKNFISLNSIPHVNCNCIYCKFPQKQITKFRWHNRGELWKDQKEITKKTFDTFIKLKNILNTYHNTNISERGWKLILWPWLYTLHVTIYDIEGKLKKNNSLFMNKNILIKSSNYVSSVPKDYDNFTQIVKNFKFYKIILTHIAPKFLKNITIKIKKKNETSVNKSSNKLFPRILHKLLIRVYFLLIKKNKIAFFSSYIPWPKRLIYYFKFRSFPMFNNFVNFNIMKDIENDILFRDINNKFEDSYLSLAIKLIPKSYLENFKEYSIFSSTIFPQSPLFAVTGTGHFNNDIFKIWMANRLQKSKLIIIQHGGHYGLGKISNCQAWEFDISDYFLSWGWLNKSYPKIIPYGKFIKPISKNLKIKSQILYIIGSGNDRYISSTISMPLGEQWLDYINSITKFINNLDSNIISKTIIRPYPSKIGWDQDKIYNDNFKSIKIEKMTTDINESIRKARLVLCTWNSTNFLNLLYSNIPTVCFWDQNLFEIEKTAQPLINQLYRTKVLHKNYQSASLFINKNWEKIDNWWYSSQTQQSIKNFIDNYATNQKSANNIFENSFRG